ncbi:MAG: hypothetical protein Q4D91_14930 [Lautropia sp.]|nr:hypothetical protein [Lautropia sp.]
MSSIQDSDAGHADTITRITSDRTHCTPADTVGARPQSVHFRRIAHTANPVKAARHGGAQHTGTCTVQRIEDRLSKAGRPV